jgi:cation:H+ antiporter
VERISVIEHVAYMVVGLAILVFGADWLVKGASRLAMSFGIAPLVVGLTVVAFGTSAPELAVSVASAMEGATDLAVANVVGSNIANILLILGASALVAPLIVHQQLVRMDVPIMIGMSVLLYVLVLDGRIGLLDSALFFGLIVFYTVFLVRESRRERNPQVVKEYAEGVEDAAGDAQGSVALNLLLVVLGVAALVGGAKLLVDGAIELARVLGISEAVIGLTLVAVGTSLPELATSMVAAFKGERDIAIGNVVGSNIFNIGSVLGLSGLASAGALTVSPSMQVIDVPVMLGVALLCMPLFVAGYVVTRTTGAVFIGCYALYIAWLVVQEAGGRDVALFADLLRQFMLPALVIGAVVVLLREMRKPGAARRP